MNQTNQMGLDRFSCDSPSVELYRYLGVVWGCSVIITGTVGNLLTVLAFTFKARLRSRSNMLIVNLAVADLLYCSMVQPFSVDSYLHWRGRAGQLWCTVFGLLLFLFHSVSIITLCLIAISRYLLIAERHVFDRVFSKRRLVVLMFSAWALSMSSFGPLWSVYVFVPQVCTCSIHRTEGLLDTTTLLFVYFFVGLSCVGIFYLLIYRQVIMASKTLLQNKLIRRFSNNKSACSVPEADDSGVETKTSSFKMNCQTEGSQNLSQNSSEETSQPTQSFTVALMHHPSKAKTPPHNIANTSPSTHPAPTTQTPRAVPQPTVTFNLPHQKAPRSDAEFQRVTLMCFIVFLCFVFCFAPYLLLNLFDKHNRAPPLLQMFCANLTWLNSCINPVLYAVMNRPFRRAYWSMFTWLAAPFSCIWTPMKRRRV